MQRLRFLLYPFSILYDGITGLRNWSFDKGILEQKEFDIPVIAVGNLSTGGTGKTPMIEFLIRQHSDKRIAVLSRGYGRKTKGYLEVAVNDNTSKVGDEPLQLKSKFKDSIIVAVCEKRALGIENLLNDHEIDLILLDDAFQHRYVKATHYYLLSSFDKPYYKDYMLPVGNLRESRAGAHRANSIVITKCPNDLKAQAKKYIIQQIQPSCKQKVYFSTINYGEYAINDTEEILLSNLEELKLGVLTGIAKPKYFIEFLKRKNLQFKHHRFSDHYNYKEKDVDGLAKYDVILTTEKDFVRLKQFDLPNVYFVPIETQFLGESPESSISDNL